MKKIGTFGFGIVILLLLSCSKYEEKEMQEMSCESVGCTNMHMSVTTKVVDGRGNPVALDRMKVTRLSNGQDLTRDYADYEWDTFQSVGRYPIASDSDYHVLPRFREIPLRFQGYIGSKEVVNAVYVVSFDCCHISLVSGDQELIVR